MLSEDGRNRMRCRQMMYCGPVKANNQKCSVMDIAIQAWMLVSSLNILNDHIWKTLTTFLNYVCIKRNLNHLYHSRKAFFKKFSLLLFLFKLFLAIFCNSFSFLPLLLQFQTVLLLFVQYLHHLLCAYTSCPPPTCQIIFALCQVDRSSFKFPFFSVYYY